LRKQWPSFGSDTGSEIGQFVEQNIGSHPPRWMVSIALPIEHCQFALEPLVPSRAPGISTRLDVARLVFRDATQLLNSAAVVWKMHLRRLVFEDKNSIVALQWRRNDLLFAGVIKGIYRK
jgi:hypothetical protein